jgi:leucyl/phenylalanyl-tRNA--protein transferase
LITKFPPIESADEYGLLAAGGDLEIESLLLAYRSGIFPWPIQYEDEDVLAWFSPPKRALLYVEDFHISKSLKRSITRRGFKFRCDTKFRTVVEGCTDRVNSGTWITPEMIEAYYKLHLKGFAHSLECYVNDALVGGLYGVAIGEMFAAESMFYRETDASKATLLVLCRVLQSLGVRWIDCQVISNVTKALGAIEVDRNSFLAELSQLITKPQINFHAFQGKNLSLSKRELSLLLE